MAKWQRLDGYVSGVYAVKVVGSVSAWFLEFRKGSTLGFEEGEKIWQCPNDIVVMEEIKAEAISSSGRTKGRQANQTSYTATG